MALQIEFIPGKGLAELNANIYVNAASIYPLSVQGWGGVAGSLRIVLQKDPLSYQTLMDDWTRKNEHIPKGTADFVRDNAGNPVSLSWQNHQKGYLIHAGAPDSGDEQERMATLMTAYQAILECTQTILPLFHSPITLAIAPLGIGIYGNPPELSAQAAVKSVQAFEQRFNAFFTILFPLYHKHEGSPDKLFQQAFMKCREKY